MINNSTAQSTEQAANRPIKFAFFGTPDRAVIALNTLEQRGFVPSLIITQPDRPQGRKLIVTPPPVKVWAVTRGIPVLQPERMDDPQLLTTLTQGEFDVCIVVAYGHIMPLSLLNIARCGSLNLHGSLLPRLRGASPIETAILTDERVTGASIIKMDDKMDHGPILTQRAVDIAWPPSTDELAHAVVTLGAELIAEALPAYCAGTLMGVEQDHAKATYTKKLTSADAEIDFGADPYQNFLKIRAFSSGPRAHFFAEIDGKKMRITITDATFSNGKLTITKVIPEGKRETSADQFVPPNVRQ